MLIPVRNALIQIHFIAELFAGRCLISQIAVHMVPRRVLETNARIITICSDYIPGTASNWCPTSTPSRPLRFRKSVFATILDERIGEKFNQLKSIGMYTKTVSPCIQLYIHHLVLETILPM